MDTIPVLTAPAWVGTPDTIDLYMRAEYMLNQREPLPTVVYLALTPSQWQEWAPGMRDDVGRQIVGFIGSYMAVLPYSTAINPLGGQSWELTALSRGWWYEDPPGITSAAKIPPGPQLGQVLSEPNYAIADALFASGSWAWFLWA